MTVVSDTSVLLNLCLIGQQEILRVFFKQVWVPVEVKLEFDYPLSSFEDVDETFFDDEGDDEDDEDIDA